MCSIIEISRILQILSIFEVVVTSFVFPFGGNRQSPVETAWGAARTVRRPHRSYILLWKRTKL